MVNATMEEESVANLMLQILNHEYFGGVPLYHVLIEAVLLLLLLRYAIFTDKPQPTSGKPTLSKKEEDELIEEWEPEPLAPPSDRNYKETVCEGIAGVKISVEGKQLANFSSFNFLGFIGHERIQNVSIAAAKKYGIGSCGPRGFYGTIDCHLELEQRLAQFFGAEEAVLYSYGFSTIASLIPAYSKRGDIIFYDEGVSFATQKGLEASRSLLIPFKHNDMDDLEEKLKAQQKKDEADPRKARATRRFFVVEGLYENFGDIAPLDKLVSLKYQYKVRLFVEESMSFGVLGATGRGITEHFNIPMEQIDGIAASMSNALGSIGGFTCGRSFVMDHQRLSGLGYCYSASLPPLLAVAALEALSMIDESKKEGKTLPQRVAENAARFRQSLKGNLQKAKISDVDIGGFDESPIIHLRLTDRESRDEAKEILHKVVDVVKDKSVFLSTSTYIEKQEMHLPEPSIRVCTSAGHSNDDIDNAAKAIAQAFKKVL
eukprot:m.45496 g.45496  ORF g.45496 m.45496 type:complete len:488 (+) comp10252_c1_seq1:160-1623(+)